MARIICRLKELIARYEVETGERLSYERLSDSIGVGERTLRRWANNQVDHKVIVELCKFFNAQPGDLLEYIPSGTEVPQE